MGLKTYVPLHADRPARSVYVLVDPTDGAVRYVGSTSRSPSKRLQDHVAGRNARSSAKDLWIRDLVNRGLRPSMRIVVVLEPDGGWKEVEAFLIKHYQSTNGSLLTNHTDTGLAGSKKGRSVPKLRGNQHAKGKGRPASEERKRKLREGWERRKQDPDWFDQYRQSVSRRSKGRKVSEETRRRMSEAAKARDPETRKHSEETKAKIAEANRRRVWTEESKQKIAEARRREAEERRMNLGGDPK